MPVARRNHIKYSLVHSVQRIVFNSACVNQSSGGQTGSNFPLNFNTTTLSNTSTVEYNSLNGVNQTVFDVVSPGYGHLIFTNGSGSGTTTKTAGGGLDVRGNITINSLATFAGGTSLVHTITGNWTNNGTFTAGTSTVIFNASTGIQTLKAGSSSFNAVSHNAAGTLQLITNNLTTTGTFTNSAGTFDAISLTHTSGGLVTINGGSYLAGTVLFNGSLTISGGTFTGSSSIVTATNITLSSGTLNAPSSLLNVSGNWNNSGTYNHNNGTIIFNGASSQTISGSMVTDFNNLTLNNSNGLTLNTSANVNATLTLTSGLLTTGVNSITVALGGSINNASVSSYVNGILKRVYSAPASLVFPVGKGGNYRPLSFEYIAVTGTSTVSVEQNEIALSGTLPSSTNLNNSRTWNISQTGGSSINYKVTLDGTGDNISGTVVMLRKESGTITSIAVTTPNYTNTTGLSTLTGTVDFTTGSTCSATANAGVDQTGAATCGLTTVTLAGNAPTLGTGAWTVVSGSGGSFGNSTSPTSTLSGTAGTAYNLQWTVTNGNCAANDQVLVTFNRNPTGANAGPDQTGASTCGLTTVVLAGNTPAIGTGAWTVVSGAGGSFGTATSPSSSFSGTAGTTYTLRWTISN